MTKEIAKRDEQKELTPQVQEAVLLGGNIAQLSAPQRVEYMMAVCKSLGLNPLTKPFEFIQLNGKLTMYAKKDCTEQLRKLNGISVRITAREMADDVYVVTAQATDKHGRGDESIGAVPIKGLTGEAKANALMKAETKAKRRVTLSISGLGMLDETEVETIPGAQRLPEYTPPVREVAARESPKAATATTSNDSLSAALIADAAKATASAPDREPGSDDDEEETPEIDPLELAGLMLNKKPKGLGWVKSHAMNWLKKYFGAQVEGPADLTNRQRFDARMLLQLRIKSEDEYNARLEQFAVEGRVLGEGEVAA